MIYVYYITLFTITILIINFNKELIDNVESNPKEQKEWHYAQMMQWVVIFSSLGLWSGFLYETIIYGCFYPTIYDLGLNLGRGLDWNHKGVHDLPVWLKIVLIVIGSILIIIQ